MENCKQFISENPLHPKLRRQALLVFGANMIIMNCGFGIGVTSPMISQLREEKMLDEDMASWFASSLVLGQIVGSIFGAWLANTVGRRKACIGSAFLSIFGWLIICGSQSSWMLITGRVWTGFFDSLSYPACIMFISEISEMKLRGSFLNSTALACGLGIAFGYLIGFNAFWRLACLAPIIQSATAIFLLWFCCESPVYLLMKREEASQSLRWYREVQQEEEKDRLEVEREMKEMEEETSSTASSLKVSAKKLLAGENLRAYLVLGTLFMLYPLTGMYSITFFAVDLFSKLGLGDANTVAVITAFVRCLGTSLSSVLLYKFGRRKIMILSTALVTVIMGLIAGLVTTKEAGVEIDDTAVCWALTILIILFMFCVGLALVSFPWMLMAEWFSPDLKSLVSSSLITFQFLMIFIAVQTTAPIINLVGNSGLFIYFCLVCAIKTVVIFFFVPETHGRTYSTRTKGTEV